MKHPILKLWESCLVRVLFAVVFWGLLLAGPAGARAQQTPVGDGSELTVYLLTMGQGDFVWEKFGHNAIWIHDELQATNRVYNYGVFDFSSPGYWGRFVKGTWIYQLAAEDVAETAFTYQYLNRTLTTQELNLTSTQKRELRDFLEWNLLPENREYRYDYFRDNCSTRIRDALDRVLDGRIRAATESVTTEATYRWHSNRLMADDQLTYTGMNAGLGPRADLPINQWEEMFLPAKVQERVRDIQVPMSDGSLEPLVREERVVFQAVDREPERTTPPRWIPIFLLIGVLVAAVILGLARTTPGSAVGRFAFSAVSALWTLLIGFGGVILAALWALTDHEIAHRNENLLQFDPLALGLVVLLPALAYGARWAARPARILAFTVAGLSVVGFVLQLLPGVDQVNGEVIALTLPVHVAIAYVASRGSFLRPLVTQGSSGSPRKQS